MEKMFDDGEEISSNGDFIVECNFQSFPERITMEITEGEYVWGLHFSHNIEEFSGNHTLCCYSAQNIDLILENWQDMLNRCKASHGDTVYAVKMHPNNCSPLIEVEGNEEYRQKAMFCEIRKIDI